MTVLIGIAVGKESVAGVIHQPYWNYKSADPNAVIGRTFYGLIGSGVYGLSPVPPPADQRIVTTTRSHGTGLVQQALEVLKPDQVLKVGGAGHKVMLLMEGEAHAYVFPSPGIECCHSLTQPGWDNNGEPGNKIFYLKRNVLCK